MPLEEAPALHPHMKSYSIIANAVHAGVVYGYGRAHKHVPNPDADALREAIYGAVMLELSEVLDFDASCCVPLKPASDESGS